MLKPAACILRPNHNRSPLCTVRERWNTWFVYFLVFCFIGWVYEELVFAFELGYGFVNRGFLFGPYLPVYGFGGLLIIASMHSLRQKDLRLGRIPVTPILCFLAVMILATATELLTSYLMQAAIGEWLWDYSADGPNFQGRIALKSSLRFGLIGLAGIYAVHPLLRTLTDRASEIRPRTYKAATVFLFMLFLTDVASRAVLGSNYVGP